ncbi:MAG: hypothetical protein BWY78_01294 [Alphaproteobacteria bacterium ADurb.Bin438]|nr:MAG: hypothetical protein BWY78_01294 [Alphaproteobacteria bacterium ADurb.Bin438]
MYLKVKEYVFAPALSHGDLPNPYSEDSFLISDNLIAVVDGIRGLTQRRILKTKTTDTEWFVDTVIKGLRQVTNKRDVDKSRDYDDPKKILKTAIDYVIARFKEEGILYSDIKKHELPTASLMMVMKLLRVKETNRFLFSHMAGGAVMWHTKEDGFSMSLSGEDLSNFDVEVEMLIRTLLMQGKSGDEIKEAVINMAKASRHIRNQDDTYCMLDMSYSSFKHKGFRTYEKLLNPGDKVLLASSGFLRYVNIFKKTTYEDMFYKSFTGSLRGIVEAIREQEKWDMSCQMYQRTRKSDDICAVTIEVKDN